VPEPGTGPSADTTGTAPGRSGLGPAPRPSPEEAPRPARETGRKAGRETGGETGRKAGGRVAEQAPGGPAGPNPAAEEVPSVRRQDPPAVPPPRLWPQLEELAAFVGSAPLPPSAKVPGLLERLRSAGPGPTTEPIVHRRLPLAVDGYLRALTWQPWVADGVDPVAELARVVDEMAAMVPVAR
ncbi:hypothetical protein ACFCX4_05785, partial [Kitasatospora sp. NPDC056327]